MRAFGDGWVAAPPIGNGLRSNPGRIPDVASAAALCWAVVRVVGLPWVAATLLVQGGGIGVIALGVAVESASSGGDLGTRLWSEVPRAWAVLAAPLALAASARAVFVLHHRGALLALGSLGFSRLGVGFAAVIAGGMVGELARFVGVATAPAGAVVRAAGGWVVRGELRPDVTGTTLMMPEMDRQWAVFAGFVGAASLAGVSTGRGAWTLVACAGVLVADLARRGLDKSALWPAVVLGLFASAALVRRALRPGGELR